MQAHIDLAPLAASAGARLILAEATAIDLAARRVAVTGRPDVPFDLLSIDVGGEPAMPPGDGLPVKPIGQFLARLAALEAELAPGARIAVVGGGAGGTELALALARRYRERARIVLVCDGAEPLAERAVLCPVRCAHGAGRGRRRTGLWRARGPVGRWQAGAVRRQLPGGCDCALGDRGGRAGDAGRIGPGLRRGRAACGWTATLRSVSHDFVFAAGDCAADRGQSAAEGRRLGGARRRASGGQPATGGTRADAAALAAAVAGAGDLGARPADALWLGAMAWRSPGGLVWRWKDWIDRRWMRMYQEPMAPMAGEDPMRCGGCGAKVGAEVLAGALADLPRMPGADVLIGLDAPDDAAVMLPPPGMAVVQSVDHFRAFIDDPFVFGQIAAAHALSDLHAMGARPWTALAVAAVPYTSGDKMRTELGRHAARRERRCWQRMAARWWAATARRRRSRHWVSRSPAWPIRQSCCASRGCGRATCWC